MNIGERVKLTAAEAADEEAAVGRLSGSAGGEAALSSGRCIRRSETTS
jgi:hypothetical protein